MEEYFIILNSEKKYSFCIIIFKKNTKSNIKKEKTFLIFFFKISLLKNFY